MLHVLQCCAETNFAVTQVYCTRIVFLKADSSKIPCNKILKSEISRSPGRKGDGFTELWNIQWSSEISSLALKTLHGQKINKRSNDRVYSSRINCILTIHHTLSPSGEFKIDISLPRAISMEVGHASSPQCSMALGRNRLAVAQVLNQLSRRRILWRCTVTENVELRYSDSNKSGETEACDYDVAMRESDKTVEQVTVQLLFL